MMDKDGIGSFDAPTISLGVGPLPTAAEITGGLLPLLSLDADPSEDESETPSAVYSGPVRAPHVSGDEFAHLYEDFGEREMECDSDGEELRAWPY